MTFSFKKRVWYSERAQSNTESLAFKALSILLSDNYFCKTYPWIESTSAKPVNNLPAFAKDDPWNSQRNRDEEIIQGK